MKTRPLHRLFAFGMLCLAFAYPENVRALVDDNQNQMSDVWEAAHGPGLKPNDDLDGDGVSNRDESEAFTDPRDPLSVLTVEPVKLSPGAGGSLAAGTARVAWQSVAGKRYRLSVSFDLQNWFPSSEVMVGDGRRMERVLPLPTSYPSGVADLFRFVNLDPYPDLDFIKSLAANTAIKPVPLDALEIPPTDPDEDNFGQMIRGWLIPPTDGTYTFWIASDDDGELWLSTDASPAHKSRIASVEGYTDFREWTKFPSQKSAPVTLNGGASYYFEVFQADGGGGDHLSVAWTGPGLNADKEIITGRYLATNGISLQQRLSASGTIFFRVSASDADRDGDGVADAEEALVGFNPDSKTTIARTPDGDSIRKLLAAANVVTVGASSPRAYEAPAQSGRFTIARTGNAATPLSVSYTITGMATAGVDYESMSGSVFLAAGQNAAEVEVRPIADALIEPAETVVVKVDPDPAYEIGNPDAATVTIDDAPDALFVATLRPDQATRSGGSGTAVLRLAGNQQFATLRLSFANLTSAETAAEIEVTIPGNPRASVHAFPLGQVSKERWELDAAESGLTREQILAALQAGQLGVRVRTARAVGGEITGTFLPQPGGQTMPIPPSPPAWSATTPTDAAAARFLTQATFGPTTADIARLKTLGYSGWLDEQFAKPATLHLPYVQARRQELLARSNGEDDGYHGPRQEAWWQAAIKGEDQLRQRVAFALSEIFVVSDVGTLEGSTEGLANYYDLLVTHAFGNYRDLLEAVTLSPIMGQYLSMVRNAKPDPETGSEPDENYAREVMQLFSIGLSRLHPDGSLLLDGEGMPIPTYRQADIVGLAHVFTGWGFAPVPGEDPSFFYGEPDEIHPMVQYPEFHDLGIKRIVNGVTVPAGLTGEQDLKLALDTLFLHPNVGPLLARQLIQRLVTSNPSPGYTYRVASVFNDNGNGVRGDLQATVRAVLLDYEARSPDLLADSGYGKLREPLLRATHLFRAFKVSSPRVGDDRIFLDYEYSPINQAPLQSPSVFNFFQPGYIHPGPIAAAGLYSPEFQITSETSVLNQANAQFSLILYGVWTNEEEAGETLDSALDIGDELALLKRKNFSAVASESALLDALNRKLLSGQMSVGLRQNITAAYAALPDWFDRSDDRLRDRINLAIYLIFASPEYTVQK